MEARQRTLIRPHLLLPLRRATVVPVSELSEAPANRLCLPPAREGGRPRHAAHASAPPHGSPRFTLSRRYSMETLTRPDRPPGKACLKQFRISSLAISPRGI